MFDSLSEYFAAYEDTPPEIFSFEQAWLATLAVTVVIDVDMFDYSMSLVGPFVAALTYVVGFLIAVALMAFTSRRRSNLARWLLVGPFSLLILFYDLAHFSLLVERVPMAYVAAVQLGLVGLSIYLLFRPNCRAWFAARDADGNAGDSTGSSGAVGDGAIC
ncbi:MAG: hypothetical protein JSR90_01270 [Proteobacteria bacterium]|nr:hypothetical protein [Pseudomonadota bacterium]